MRSKSGMDHVHVRRITVGVVQQRRDSRGTTLCRRRDTMCHKNEYGEGNRREKTKTRWTQSEREGQRIHMMTYRKFSTSLRNDVLLRRPHHRRRYLTFHCRCRLAAAAAISIAYIVLYCAHGRITIIGTRRTIYN